MSDLGQTIRVLAVRFERTLPGPVERVWLHLTDCNKLGGWYGEASTIEPHEGGAVRLGGGHIRGVVTQWRPNRKLAYTWNVFAPGEDESAYPESYLTLELQPKAGNTALALTHLPILDRFEKQNAMGWHTFLDMMGAALQGDAVEPRASYMKRNAEKYGVDLANLTR